MRSHISPLLVPLALALSTLACNNRPSTQEEASPPAVPAGKLIGTPGKTGTAKISGHARWTGPAQDPKAAPVSFPECKDRKPIPPMLVAADGGLANVFVSVSAGLAPGDYPLPSAPVELDQQSCEFLPRVFGIRAGQPLVMINGDPMLHNVHARGQGPGLSSGANAFNVAMPIQNSKMTRRFTEPQVAVTIVCDVHPWMRAYAGVVDNPFWAVTGADGSFSIPGLPAGTYTLEAWHERQGKRTAQVTVADGAAAVADFAFAP